MPSSMFEDAVLNGIASGLVTRKALCATLNVGYYTIGRVLHNLLEEHRISLHSADDGQYSLSAPERHRLYPFAHVPLLIGHDTCTFPIDGMSPTYAYDTLEIYLLSVPFFSEEVGYVVPSPVSPVLTELDRHAILAKFLPILCLPYRAPLSPALLRLVLEYHQYQFPITVIDGDRLVPISTPTVTPVNTFENPHADKLLQCFVPQQPRTIAELVSMTGHHRETVRKTLMMLVNQGKLQRKKDLKFAQSQFFLPS